MQIGPSWLIMACNLTDLGSILGRGGNLDNSIIASRGALVIFPTYAGAHGNLGLANKKKGDLDGAIAEYREVLKVYPEHVAAISNQNLALKLKAKQ